MPPLPSHLPRARCGGILPQKACRAPSPSCPRSLAWRLSADLRQLDPLPHPHAEARGAWAQSAVAGGCLSAQGCSFPAVGSHLSDTCWCSCFAGEGALPGWELGTWWGGPQLPRTPRLLGVGEMPLVNSRGSCCRLLSPKKYGEFLQKQVLVFSFSVGVTSWWCRN